jgi:SOS response regulatory protein OraA/RecX
MSTKSKAYAEQISDAQVMKSGLKAHLDELQQRGISPQFIDTLEESINSSIEQNNAQEKLKADLKAATATLETLLKKLDASMSEATKVVKLQMPQEQWKEFGIKAKR